MTNWETRTYNKSILHVVTSVVVFLYNGSLNFFTTWFKGAQNRVFFMHLLTKSIKWYRCGNDFALVWFLALVYKNPFFRTCITIYYFLRWKVFRRGELWEWAHSVLSLQLIEQHQPRTLFEHSQNHWRITITVTQLYEDLQTRMESGVFSQAKLF